MNETLIKKTLDLMSEEAIPIDLDGWTKIQARFFSKLSFETSKRHSILKRENLMDFWMVKPKFLRIAMISALITILVVAGLFATSQGQAIAQNLFRYFTTVSQTSIPPIPTPLPVPTYTFGTKLIPQPTISTNQPGCGKVISPISSTFVCQLQDAQTRSGFTVKSFPSQYVKASFGFISFEPDHSISINMRDQQGGYYLGQGLGDFPNSFPVNQDFVKIVKVGEFQAEYVNGDFYFTADKGRVWEPNAPFYQLRWKESEHWYWLTLMVNQSAGLQSFEIQGKMIQIAENLISIDQGADLLAVGNQPSVKDSAGFTIKEPSLMPEGFQLQVADGRWGNLTTSPRVEMRFYYFVNGQVENILTLDQMLIPGDDNTLRKEFDRLYRNPSIVTTKIKADEVVKINGITGYYLDGGESLPNALSWRDDEREYLLFHWWSPNSGGRLDKKTLIAIAESMK